MGLLELNRYPLHAYSKNSSAVPHSHPSKQVVMSSTEWAQAALQSFDAVVSATEGFRSRPGQRLMAEQVARTFSRATLGKVDEESGEPAPTRSIAVIQAGTGVGKSLAYCAPAIALALARGTRV